MENTTQTTTYLRSLKDIKNADIIEDGNYISVKLKLSSDKSNLQKPDSAYYAVKLVSVARNIISFCHPGKKISISIS